MKKSLKRLMLGISAALMSATAMAQIPAFPGAEGFGKYTTGGRGYQIYHVTSLDDSGPGTLRDAVTTSGRIVVFDVAGDIILQSPLVFKGNITVLGQTAPGEGVNVYGNRVSFSNASNLIVRYMRFREGNNGPSNTDACGVANGENMIFDHLSVFWGKDENFSVSWDNKNVRPRNITIQNTIIAQGLQSHSCGGLIQTIGGVTLYRNLYIENKTRNPKVKGLNQYVNNVVYNWGNGGCYIQSDSEGDSWADIQNNYFMRGPWNGATDPFTRGIQTFRLYGNGNYYDDNKDGVLNGHLMTDEEQIGKSEGTAPYSTLFESLDALNANIDAYNADHGLTSDNDNYIKNITPVSNMMTAEEAYAWILENCGASLPVRDCIDQYVIDEMASYGTAGTKNGITSELQLPHKGHPNLSGGPKPLDSDGDGIPDEWETANGLNPDNASDAAAIAENGYANIENYANSIVAAFPYIKKPLSLSASETGKTSITLSWDANGNTTAGYEITATTADGVVVTASAPAGATSATVEGLAPRTLYTITLRATDGEGLYSDEASIVVSTIDDPTPPATCENPSPAIGEKVGVASGLTFSWESPVTYGGEVTYTLYLGNSAESMTAVASDIKTTSFTTTDILPNASYYWHVDATNSLGTTEGPVWNFTTTAGGVLFYTDFHTQPDEWVEKYGYITENTNIINAANTTIEVAGMTIGTGDNAIRILNMPGLYSDDLNSDYGPATEDDRGATPYAIQFNTTKEGGYMTLPQVEGPCVLTLWLGNPDKSQKTVKLVTTNAAGESSVQDLVLGAKKRVYKHTITYTRSGNVTFKIDANAKKFDVNDVLIEKWIPAEGEQPLELTDGSLVNKDMPYADGTLTLTFNQEVKYNGEATISGIHQWEDITIGASGTKLNIGYNNLDILSDYVVSFPAGALTDVTGEKSFEGDITISTMDFPRAKIEGDTHFGKAAAELPLNFAPFDAIAPFATVGGLVQDKSNDYPHWVQVSPSADIPGEATADHATITTKNDKLMAYFAQQSKALALTIEPDGNVATVIKIQESRNCDITPGGWRTIRTLTDADLPFTAEIPLNPETRMIKVYAPTISNGGIVVKTMRISDSEGYFGEGYDGISDVSVDALDPDAPAYNILGLPVGPGYRGIVIQNGHKYLRR